jgi:PAS domain S-box-containing protein
MGSRKGRAKKIARDDMLKVTMDSIGDAIITTDIKIRVTYLNPMAEHLTGWTNDEAAGHQLDEVFRIVNNLTKKTVKNPALQVLKTGRIVGLANHTLLLARDGKEYQIADSASPIRSLRGRVIGVVLVFRDVTRQYAINQELRESRERFRSLFENLTDGVVVANLAEETVFLVNKAFSIMIGRSPDRLSGQSLSSLHPPPASGEILGLARRQVVGETKIGTDVPLLRADGSILFCDVSSSIIVIERRKYLLGIFRDATERRQREEKFRALFEASPMGVHTYRVEDGRLIFAGGNPAADRMLGIDHFQLVGKPILEAFPQLVQTEVPARYLKTALSGDPWQTEQIAYKDDRVDGAFLVRAFQTAPGRMAAMFLDVTESRKIADELQKSEARYKSLVENSPSLIARFDTERRLIFANEKAINFYKGLIDASKGLKPEDIGPYKDRAEVVSNGIRDVLATGRTVEFEIEAGQAPDLKYVSYLMVPERDVSGRIISVLVVGHDITRQKHLETQLRHSEKMQAIGQLAGGIAHDFNNHLTGILGYAELVKEEAPPGSNLRQYAEGIVASALKSAQLTNRLLAFGRKGKYQSVAVDIHAAVNEAVELLRRSLDRKYSIITRLDAPDHTVIGDPSQLQNAILNLCINSRDAMPDGGEIRIITEAFHPDRSFLVSHGLDASKQEAFIRIAVSDTGVGIPQEIRERIFDPFFTTKEQGQGTGLGLAAVYGTVRNHKAAIEVESESGKGSVFHLYFPVHKVESIEPKEQPVKGWDFLSGKRVLVIDDEGEICGLAEALLHGVGCVVTTVSSGAEALALYAGHASKFDVILLDLMMPGMSGREVFMAIRRIDPSARVILVSGYALNEEVQNLLDSGARGFVQKPFERETLFQSLVNTLSE